MSTIIINEDYDSDLEIFEQRNQQSIKVNLT